ncbi:unnamed protein product [Haemonchus placei]|uniref:Uncharacterized protein n=1 Tax=Haemonchus placei TaxID=6290 RepID=A0A0N4WEJ3_HAEPC|nr:unnamed protein product [Haemonchus placei]
MYSNGDGKILRYDIPFALGFLDWSKGCVTYSISSSGTPCCRKADHVTSRGTRSKAFSKSGKARCIGLRFSRCFSRRRRMACRASLMLQPATKPHWLVVSLTISRIRLSTIRSKTFMLYESKRIGRVQVQSSELSFFFQIGIVVLRCQLSGTFFSARSRSKNSVNRPAGFQPFDFHKCAANSSGPLALPDSIFFKVVMVSFTINF